MHIRQDENRVILNFVIVNLFSSIQRSNRIKNLKKYGDFQDMFKVKLRLQISLPTAVEAPPNTNRRSLQQKFILIS